MKITWSLVFHPFLCGSIIQFTVEDLSLCVPAAGMTMEVLGTLVGAAIQGQIVASAHTLKHCPHNNLSAGLLGNSSGTEVIRSLVLSQDLSHAVCKIDTATLNTLLWEYTIYHINSIFYIYRLFYFYLCSFEQFNVAGLMDEWIFFKIILHNNNSCLPCWCYHPLFSRDVQ